jgi:hypothetical protein
MLNPGAGGNRCKAHPLALASVACAILLAGCGKPSAGPSTLRQQVTTKNPVSCELRCEWTSEGLVANVSFKNVTDGDLRLLKRNLLIGEEATELTWAPFEITRRSARIAYRGQAVTPVTPTEADYLTLTPGEVVTATVNLGAAYDLSAPGTYRVRYASVNFSSDGRSRIDIASNTVEIEKPASP